MGDLGTGLLGSCRRGRQVGKRAWLSAHMDGCGLKTVGPLTRRQGKLMLLSGQGDGLSGHFGLDKDANSRQDAQSICRPQRTGTLSSQARRTTDDKVSHYTSIERAVPLQLRRVIVRSSDPTVWDAASQDEMDCCSGNG